jgi:choline kinase
MKAIILAAGRGSRLRPHTDALPKGLLPLGGTTLVHRTIGVLRELGIADISLVVGYLKDRFFTALPNGVRFYVNDNYDATDQAASLLAARAEFTDDVLVVTGDLLCASSVYADMLGAPAPVAVAVDRTVRVFDDAIEKVLFEQGRITRIGKLNVRNDEANGEFMGMTLFRAEAGPSTLQRLDALVARDRRSALIHLHQDRIDAGHPLGYIECQGEWCEVDDVQSLERARRILDGGSAA